MPMYEQRKFHHTVPLCAVVIFLDFKQYPHNIALTLLMFALYLLVTSGRGALRRTQVSTLFTSISCKYVYVTYVNLIDFKLDISLFLRHNVSVSVCTDVCLCLWAFHSVCRTYTSLLYDVCLHVGPTCIGLYE